MPIPASPCVHTTPQTIIILLHQYLFVTPMASCKELTFFVYQLASRKRGTPIESYFVPCLSALSRAYPQGLSMILQLFKLSVNSLDRFLWRLVHDADAQGFRVHA